MLLQSRLVKDVQQFQKAETLIMSTLEVHGEAYLTHSMAQPGKTTDKPDPTEDVVRIDGSMMLQKLESFEALFVCFCIGVEVIHS